MKPALFMSLSFADASRAATSQQTAARKYDDSDAMGEVTRLSE